MGRYWRECSHPHCDCVTQRCALLPAGLAALREPGSRVAGGAGSRDRPAPGPPGGPGGPGGRGDGRHCPRRRHAGRRPVPRLRCPDDRCVHVHVHVLVLVHLDSGFFCFLLRAGAKCSREEWRLSKDRYAEMSVFPKVETFDPLCTTMSFFYSRTLTISSSLSDSESIGRTRKT